MKRFILALFALALLSSPSSAQFNGCSLGFCAPKVVPAGVATTWNPADKGADITLSNGNLTANYTTSTGFEGIRATISKSTGKFYAEFALTGTQAQNSVIGIGNASAPLSGFGFDGTNNAIGLVNDDRVFRNGSTIVTIQTYTLGDTVCMAVDIAAKKIWWRTNGGNWNNDVIANQNPATGAGGVDFSAMNAGPYFPFAEVQQPTQIWTANFGATTYAQTVPSGFGNWQ